jgi:hypothetical protein
MGALSLETLVESYFQYLEHEQIDPIIIKQGVSRYDILVLYNHNKPNIEQILNEFNKLQPFIEFTTEKKLHSFIQFTNLTIH